MPNLRHLGRHCAGGLVFILLLSFAGVLDAANVQGRLDYNNGSPAGGIAIRLIGTSGAHPPSFAAYSGRNGMYYFSQIPAGTYNLEVWRNNVRVAFLGNLVVAEPLKNVPIVRLP